MARTNRTTPVDLSGMMLKNAPISPATHTKIDYDAKWLVLNGTDATADDIAETTNRKYMTTTEKTKVSNLSGTNTWDQIIPQLTGTPDYIEPQGNNFLRKLINLVTNVTGTLPVLSGWTWVTTSTGSWNNVLSNSPTILTPIINVTSDTTGDIYYRNASWVLTRLAPGTTGQVLAITAWIPSWITPAAATKVKVINAAGTITDQKIWSDIITPSTGTGAWQVIDISSAWFTAISSISIVAERNTANAYEAPNVAIKSYTNSAVTVNIINGSNASSFLSLLWLNVLTGSSTSLFPTISWSGIKLHVTVIWT